MGKAPGKFRMIAITSDHLRESISDTLRRKLQWTRNARDYLATQYGWGERKAESIYYGEQPPSAADLVNLMARDDDVFEAVIEMTGRRTEWDQQRKAIQAILKGRGA